MRWITAFFVVAIAGVLLAQGGEVPVPREGGADAPPGPPGSDGGRAEGWKSKGLDKLLQILDVKVESVPGGYRLSIEGTSKYPDGTCVSLNIRFKGMSVGSARAMVSGGAFTYVFEPEHFENKQLYAGMYEFEAAVRVKQQGRRIRRKMAEEKCARDDYHNVFRFIGSKARAKATEDEVRRHFAEVHKAASELLKELLEGTRKAMWKFENRYMGKEREALLNSLDEGERRKAGRVYHWYWKYDRARKKRVFQRTLWNKHKRSPDYRDMFEFYNGDRFDHARWYEWLEKEWTLKIKRLLAKHSSFFARYRMPLYPEAHESLRLAMLAMLGFSGQEVRRIFSAHAEHQRDIADWERRYIVRERRRIGISSEPDPPPATPAWIRGQLKRVERDLDLSGMRKKILEEAAREAERLKQQREEEERKKKKNEDEDGGGRAR